MKNLRRNLLITAGCLGGIMIAAPALTGARQAGPTPQPRPSPNAPTNQNAPQGLDGPPLTVDSNKQTLDRQNQAEIRMEVQRLYAMASELKEEVDKSDPNTVLSVAVLKRAQDIEKLAKQIKDRSKK